MQLVKFALTALCIKALALLAAAACLARKKSLAQAGALHGLRRLNF
jgi:hypothetical protein